MKLPAALMALLGTLVVFAAALLGFGSLALLGAAGPGQAAAGPGSPGAPAGRTPGGVPLPPPFYAALAGAAAGTCPGLPAAALLAIAEIESGFGSNDGPSSSGAVGPMQFEPATFAAYAYPVPPGGADPPSPWDATDAMYAAARDLCANGAAAPGGLGRAVFAYNHAAWYVSEVLALAAVYARGAG